MGRIITSVAALVLFASPVFAQRPAGATLPDAPRPNARKVWIAEVATLGALYATDATLTARGVNARQPEGNTFFLGAHPSRTRIGLYAGGLFLAQAITLRYTEHSRHKWIRRAGRAWYSFSVVDEGRGIYSWR